MIPTQMITMEQERERLRPTWKKDILYGLIFILVLMQVLFDVAVLIRIDDQNWRLGRLDFKVFDIAPGWKQ